LQNQLGFNDTRGVGTRQQIFGDERLLNYFFVRGWRFLTLDEASVRKGLFKNAAGLP